MIDSPEPVSRVTPPSTIITRTMPATPNSQTATSRRFRRLAGTVLRQGAGKVTDVEGHWRDIGYAADDMSISRRGEEDITERSQSGAGAGPPCRRESLRVWSSAAA